MNLQISDTLSLPLDAITQTFGVLAVRGAGKSNLAAVMAEEMHRARLPFVVVDPVGSWWGLRSSSDGKEGGLQIPIFGGRHGDVPLEKTGGAVLADLVVDDRVSCVLDISEFSEGEKTHFLIDFAERLYRRNTEPLHLFLEEADDYAPQKPFREQARLLRAWENVVRRGRARGLGMTLITQRSASLNKNVLTQIETLFVLRTTSPQDRKAIEAWVEYHGARRELLESLPGLKAGEAWVWSPQWLGKTERVQIRRRSTFDSGATPKQVKGSRPAARLADVDLGKVQERMAATIERARKTDPKALTQKNAQLEREIETLRRAAAAAEEQVREVTREVPVLQEGELERLEAVAQAVLEGIQISGRIRESVQLVVRAASPAREVRELPYLPPLPPATAVKTLRFEVGDSARQWLADILPGSGGLRRMLTALAQRPAGFSAIGLGIRAGLSPTSGTFDTYLGRARKAGWIIGDRSHLTITEQGLEALGPFQPLPEGRELLAYWSHELGGGAARMLVALAERYPACLTRQELGERAGLSASSGTFDTYLGRLRRLELVTGKTDLRASEELFS